MLFCLKGGTGVIVYTHYQLKMFFLKALFKQTSICKTNEMQFCPPKSHFEPF